MLANSAIMVVKPVDGYGGGGVLIGPACHRCRDRPRGAARSSPNRSGGSPRNWSTCRPIRRSTRDGDQPRHVDLRRSCIFGPHRRASFGARGPRRVDAGRQPAAWMVNSSRGGGAKDTWILAAGAGRRSSGTADGSGRRDVRYCGEIRFDGHGADVAAVDADAGAMAARTRRQRHLGQRTRWRSGIGGCRSSTCPRRRRAADGRHRPRADDRVQRLHLQLPGAARRTSGRRATASSRPPTPRSSSRRTPSGAPRCVEQVHGHVRVRDRRAGHRCGDAGPRPAGHQAALPRPTPGPAAVRVDAAGAARCRRHATPSSTASACTTT